jgi:hypothetical protein
VGNYRARIREEGRSPEFRVSDSCTILGHGPASSDLRQGENMEVFIGNPTDGGLGMVGRDISQRLRKSSLPMYPVSKVEMSHINYDSNHH